MARVVSGMRPTGLLHLGHYEGVLSNWLELQQQHNCFFFVADWHALTTEYGKPEEIPENSRQMVVDWLAAGIDPGQSVMFVQSHVPEHAELQLLFSMFTPLSWLERVPSYKDMQENLKNRELDTYGFLGYPLLQAADILVYKAALVPVGEDQAAHVEMAREVARRFNYIYGREPDFKDKLDEALHKLGKKNSAKFLELRRDYRERGDGAARDKAKLMLESRHTLPIADTARLLGYLEAEGRLILNEPEPALTRTSCLTGLDGRKMSKSYGNTIPLGITSVELEKNIRQMPTDPARIRKSDPGDPEKCPVWKLHQNYSSDDERASINTGCREATMGCTDCKKVLTEGIEKVIAPIREKRAEYSEQTDTVAAVLANGTEQARSVARETMREVREAMKLR